MTGEASMNWVLCPACHGKTRTQIRQDTILKNFPLFCPKCRKTFLVSACNGKTEYLTDLKPDA